ncbi:acylphosphatase [Gilvimarinus sp. DA14]|uniref:acylphosphatase n=1 Tax=Gilvimarinus sp. DA14 TaxID=2956798 RepID=UPI0020B827B2|nr:acylphosphatase [Gilvimarinus sp. DA14]UTF59200.1 acylphosphatase [Gilvimarinus sp. DA14]
MEQVSRRFWVTGRVQGVHFRASTERKARELGVTGWVRNLTDGRVEVLATAPDTALTELEAWLHLGSDRAEVISVEVQHEELQAFDGFSVVATV